MDNNIRNLFEAMRTRHNLRIRTGGHNLLALVISRRTQEQRQTLAQTTNTVLGVRINTNRSTGSQESESTAPDAASLHNASREDQNFAAAFAIALRLSSWSPYADIRRRVEPALRTRSASITEEIKNSPKAAPAA